MNAPQPEQLLADRAYIGMRDRILRLELSPGAALDEEALMSELGVGRTPVREAVKRLALEDLVVVYPRRGTFVADINITDLGHISELRRQLEGFAAFKAAQVSSSDDPRFQALLAELAEALSLDTTALMTFDRRVHYLIYELSGNPFLESAAHQLYNLSVRIWYLVLPRLTNLGDTVGEHRHLLDAIAAGDAERARELAEEHVSRFADVIRATL